jgi:hypothetical protein
MYLGIKRPGPFHWPRFAILVTLSFLLSLMVVPVTGLAAEWRVEKDGDFNATGHTSDGIGVSEDRLVLATELQGFLQKDWTGSAGQSKWDDATSYYSSSGLDGSTPDRITLDKESWTRLSDGPSPRREQVAVWDHIRHQMLVYGGVISGDTLEDVWAYSPATDDWTSKGSAPTDRYWHSASWATQMEKMIVHGGKAYSGATAKTLNDTWHFVPSSETWSQETDGPKKRYSHTLVWDPIHQRALVFGGYADGVVSKELWWYEPIGSTWQQKASASVGLYEHTAVWADSLDLMLVYGGLKSGGLSSKDLWAYDPKIDSWSQLKNGGTPRSGHAAVWDDDNEWLIVVGGHEGATDYNDTWIYESSTNSWRKGKDMPAIGRTGLSMAWDLDNGMALAYGGKTDSGEVSETWGFSPSYFKSGTLVSSAYEISDAAELGNVTFKESRSTPGCSGASIKVQLATSDSLQIGDYVFSGPSGTSTYYKSGDEVDRFLLGKKYIRYKALLETNDGTCAPILEEIEVGYKTYMLEGEYISPAYDTGSGDPNFISMEYIYGNPGGTDVKVYLRAAHTAEMAAASNWEEVAPKDTTITTSNGRYVQFKVEMESSDPGKTPFLDDIKLVYNSPPQVITSPVSPESGGPGTEFVYSVMYIDGDGETPTVRKVYIDGKAYDMEPQDFDYRTGANFTYKTKLESGAHTFSYEFSDGLEVVNSPDEGDYDGPVVNDPPTPVLNGPKRAEVGQKVKFDAVGSSDTDGTVEQYKFDFGDGTVTDWQTESKAKHTYEEKGKYSVKVHVKDDLGGESVSTVMVVTVEEPATIGIELGTSAILGIVAVIIMVIVAIVAAMALKKQKKVKADKDKAEMDKFFVRPGASDRAPRREARMGEAGYVGAAGAQGAVLEAEETVVNNCPKCGDLLEADLDFCPTCGHVLKKEPVREQKPPPERPPPAKSGPAERPVPRATAKSAGPSKPGPPS